MTRKPPLSSFRQTLAANRRAGRDLAALMGKQPMPMDMELRIDRSPTKSTIRNIQDIIDARPKRTERHVQREIIALLRKSPKIAMIDRINSGAAKMPSGRFVRFNHIYKVSGGLSPDIHATLATGGRRFVIEVKEPNWTEPDWRALEKIEGLPTVKQMREMGQKAYIDAVNAAGGIGMFANDVEPVKLLLERL